MEADYQVLYMTTIWGSDINFVLGFSQIERAHSMLLSIHIILCCIVMHV